MSRNKELLRSITRTAVTFVTPPSAANAARNQAGGSLHRSLRGTLALYGLSDRKAIIVTVFIKHTVPGCQHPQHIYKSNDKFFLFFLFSLSFYWLPVDAFCNFRRTAGSTSVMQLSSHANRPRCRKAIIT